jgi:hypothetical protein
MRPVRFRALIALDETETHEAFSNYTHAVTVRVHDDRMPEYIRSFPAEMCWDEERQLSPGDHAVVTVTVNDVAAEPLFEAGTEFTLWAAGNVGHGVVSRRVFFEHAPS